MILPRLLVGRVSQRDVYTIEYLNNMLAILLDQDVLAHTEVAAAMQVAGIPLTELTAMSELDPVMLTYAVESVRAALMQSVPGQNFAGIVDATPYTASRGEFVVVDGALTATVTLPDPALAVNANAMINVKMLAGAGSVTVDPAGNGLIDGATNFVLTSGDSVTVRCIHGLRGGAQIDTTNAAGADTVTILGTLFTNGGAPGAGSTDWTTAANLAAAINDGTIGTPINDRVVAVAVGVIVEVRTLYSGWMDDAALASFTVVAVFASLDDWAALGSAVGVPVALATPGQLCTTDSDGEDLIGGTYVIV